MHKNVLYKDFTGNYPTLTQADGVYVFDNSGKKYIDAIGGVGVVNIGYGVKEIIEKISTQAKKLSYAYSGQMDNKPKQRLAEKLRRWSPEDMGEIKAFFTSSGSQAIEAAIKFSYQYHFERGDLNKKKIISRWQSYHGNTIGALSLSGRTQWRTMFSPFLMNFPHIPPPYCYRCPYELSYPACGIQCATELDRVIKQEGDENVAAFIAEPLIGTSMSSVVPPAGYYKKIRQICNKHDVLFIADEVMSGIGRTGKKFAINHWNVTPDLIAAAKGLSGGYTSLASLILGEKVWKAIEEGSGKTTHSHTFGGNPISCSTGLAVLNYIEKNSLVKRVEQVGNRFKEKLTSRLGDIPEVGDIRGEGLMLGVELVKNPETKESFPANWNVTKKVVERAFKKGLLVLGGAPGLIEGDNGDHFQLLPPYTIQEQDLERTLIILENTIKNLMRDVKAEHS